MRHKLGSAIDAHAEIVRFNAFKIRGFEEFAGSCTTLWSTFGRGTLPADPEERPDRILFIHGEHGMPAVVPRELYRIAGKYFADFRKTIQARSKFTGEALAKILPSSGILVAAWILEFSGVKTIALAGFDHFRKEKSSQHHYWNKGPFTRPKEHDGDTEAGIFEEWEAQGRIAYLGR